ncbi:hypothetical protein HDA32_002592 [Spinactinospora alkalitolerans]|uniref:Uncharacterized protein n=1 Tax=Spinactinospora alkalitolerans TaxID=687207 RepID=A0A852TX45_9ACTN|nr:hypothetical protein [Spinactinospora alkalitolerans]NYE47472.1 hypothetical protein [Spinactinospora alkalitolerans]
MTTPPPLPSTSDSSASELRPPGRPPAPPRRWAAAALLGGAAAVALPAAVLFFSALESLLFWDGHLGPSRNVLAVEVVGGLLVLTGLWAVCGRVLRRLGGVGGLRWPSGVPWWGHAALVVLSGALICAAAVTLRRRRVAGAAAAAVAVMALASGAAADVLSARAELRAEFDRYTAIPVMQHSDWEPVGVEPRPDQGEVVVEYRHVRNADAVPAFLYAHRPKESDGRQRDEDCPGGTEDCVGVERGDFTVMFRDSYGPTLYMDLDAQTRVHLAWHTDSEEELVALAEHVRPATTAERAELRDMVGRLGPGGS